MPRRPATKIKSRKRPVAVRAKRRAAPRTRRNGGVPPYDPARPWLLSYGHIVEGKDYRTHSQHCCEASARMEAATARARGHLNITIVEQRPVPTKGMGGGWRVSPGARAKHVCPVVPRRDYDD